MHKYYLFLLLVLVSGITTYLTEKYVNTEDYHYYVLQKNFSDQQIENLINVKKRTQWLFIVKTPLMIAVKSALVALLLLAGVDLFNYKLNFAVLWEISLLAQFAFLVIPLTKLLWFSFRSGYDFDDIINFPTFSIADLIEKNNLNGWETHLLNIFNIAEALFLFILVLSLSTTLKVTRWQSLKIVACSYGVGYALWTVLVIFLMVNFGA